MDPERLAPFVLSNERIRLELSRESPFGLVTLNDQTSGRELLANRAAPLYRLTLSAPGGEEVAFTSADARNVTVEGEAGGTGSLALRFDGHAVHDLTVVCRVSLAPGSALTRWRIEIQNRTSYAVRGIEYPVAIAQCARSPEAGASEYFLWSFMGGQTIRDPARNLRPGLGLPWFPRRQYPGAIAVQFQAFYGPEAGIYLATEDATGSTKRFGGTVLEDDALDLSIEHSHDERIGASFELPYDTVLGTFTGGWYDAADLYKSWAVRQHWCSRTTAERDDIPGWIKEPRPWLCIISRGNYERLRGTVWSPPAEWPIGEFWPAQKVVSMMRDYSTIFGTPVVTWMEGWEYIGAPGGPVDILPPLEGAESFTSAMAALTEDGNLPSGYLAGLHWTYKRPQVGYEDMERFERDGKALATVNPHGEIDHHRFVNDQKHFVNLCIGTAATRDLYLANFARLMDLDLIALQLDQQLGLYTQPCYSEQHGHQPGFGPWMYEEMLAFIREVRRSAKARDARATFSYEMPCEIWIQEVDLHMHRPYEMRPLGVSTVPLFDYLYHAYALSYGGDTYMGLAHPEVDLIKHAYVAAYGVQNLIGIGQPEWDYAVNPAYPTLKLMRSIAQAQRTFARDFLVFGDMQRPTAASCATLAVDYYKHAQWSDASQDLGRMEVPTCVHSVWRAESGAIGHILVNWTGQPQDVRLELVDADASPYVLDGETTLALDRQGGRALVRVEPRQLVLVFERTPSSTDPSLASHRV